MKYYIIAGEASGDLHGSNLMKGLYTEDPDADIRFWGGDLMNRVYSENRKAGMSDGGLVRHYKDGAIMGFWEVFRKAGQLLGNVRFCEKDILAWRPDVVILIDYPGFNMRIARFCHDRAIKVFYYIAPKTWASRPGRNRKLKAWVDMLFPVFPFELDYFRKTGIPFVYNGNPLVDAVDSHNYSRPVDGDYIALLAGSRKAEISRMMPVCMALVDRLSALPQYSGYKFVIAGAPARDRSDYEPYIGGRSNIKLLFGETYDILRFARAAVINSGTASLEAVLIGTPQVVGWSTSALTFWIAVKILKVKERIKYISLGNLCIDRPAFRELIQDDFNPDTLYSEVRALVEDKDYRTRMLSDYEQIRHSLGGRGASEKVAGAMTRMLLASMPRTSLPLDGNGNTGKGEGKGAC